MILLFHINSNMITPYTIQPLMHTSVICISRQELGCAKNPWHAHLDLPELWLQNLETEHDHLLTGE